LGVWIRSLRGDRLPAAKGGMTMHSRSLVVTLLAGLLAAPAVVFAGDLEPPGPPAPTMRTLESLGFDCPNDPPGTTNLLFTFLTNQGGFDTGVSISNTGADPFGTVGQSGPCTLHFFGAAGSPQVVTPEIFRGTTYTTLVSTTVPIVGGFSGYMIAVCNFAYAHGFAFVSDLGARNLAMGYLAQTVCRDRKWNLGNGQ
jgi:hypothetical protein